MAFPSGVFPPMLTPFSNGEVDTAKAARYAKGLLADGAHGLCVAGSAGEFIAMDVPERQQLSEAVLAAVGGSSPVIVCVAAYRTEHSVALARHAQAAGATAVMVSAPYYMGAHVDAVWRHLSRVREAVSVPVMLYHVPATTNVELSLEVLRELVDADVIHAVKQSFYDAYHTRDAKIALGGDAAVYCGHDGSALECLLMGADGWISALPALYPSLARRLWDGVAAGEPVAALRDQWFRLLPLVKIIFDPAWRDNRGAPHWLELMHAAADILGQDVGLPRAPFTSLAGADRDRLAGILSAISAAA
ncbi:MAG TPA: dihydrodipicolinate synthase family protein [Streptosporangiaceae bacterium]|jgi:4-hydroxy-tetrahydrodipicolinate synthase|nr:dihydrodipicolinate synthase family protein [Streptosporangiaceae bacterium]